jgi:hypothetical protein
MTSRRPTSPGSASSSRNPSINTATHAPAVPSHLRESQTVSTSPEDTQKSSALEGREDRSSPFEDQAAPSSSEPSPNTYPVHLDTDPAADDDALNGRTHGTRDVIGKAVDETTSLLQKPFEFLLSSPHEGPCGHGTFSPRADSVRSADNDYNYNFGRTARARPSSGEGSQGMFRGIMETVGMKNERKKKMSTTSYLAERHGIDTRKMYACHNNISPCKYADLCVLGILHTTCLSLLGYLNIVGNICKET